MSKTAKFVISMLLVAALALSFGIGYNLGNRAFPDSAQGLESVEQAWNFIFNDYVDREELDASILSEAASGACWRYWMTPIPPTLMLKSTSWA